LIFHFLKFKKKINPNGVPENRKTVVISLKQNTGLIISLKPLSIKKQTLPYWQGLFSF